MEVELFVDGQEIEINHFVQKIMGAMVCSSVETLHGVDENWDEINIRVKRSPQ